MDSVYDRVLKVRRHFLADLSTSHIWQIMAAAEDRSAMLVISSVIQRGQTATRSELHVNRETSTVTGDAKVGCQKQ